MKNSDKLIKFINCHNNDENLLNIVTKNLAIIDKIYTADCIKLIGNFLVAPNGQAIQLHRDKQNMFYNIQLAIGKRFSNTNELKSLFANYVNNNFDSTIFKLTNYYANN